MCEVLPESCANALLENWVSIPFSGENTWHADFPGGKILMWHVDTEDERTL